MAMTMSTSTSSRSRSTAASACFRRFIPSKPNGLHTTPTVSAPASRAIRATSGAAPDPVPPPIPAVTSTMSWPPTHARMSASLSSAAPCPTSGLPPAPRPRVLSAPSCTVVGASASVSACVSVFMHTNSTPESGVGPSTCTIRLTVFEPPPPMPTTLMERSTLHWMVV